MTGWGLFWRSLGKREQVGGTIFASYYILSFFSYSFRQGAISRQLVQYINFDDFVCSFHPASYFICNIYCVAEEKNKKYVLEEMNVQDLD